MNEICFITTTFYVKLLSEEQMPPSLFLSQNLFLSEFFKCHIYVIYRRELQNELFSTLQTSIMSYDFSLRVGIV